jgi:AbrB family looped-hinge helix DNA binding protein
MYDSLKEIDMPDLHAFYGSATVGSKGQIVIPADARTAMNIKPGDKVVVVRGPQEGSIIVFRVDSFEGLMARATERQPSAAKPGVTE